MRSFKVSRLQTFFSDEARLAATPFPCGQCLPCRINKSRVWTHRLLLEQGTSNDSLFITLTYDDDFLPNCYSLYPPDLTNFFKKLRKRVDLKIRYFAVGEYGDDNWRPHYHVALFGLSIIHRPFIEQSWSFEGVQMGIVHIGELNKDSARYITGYVIKGMTTEKRVWPYCKPEFMRCSNRPGIGAKAIDKIADALLSNSFFQKRIIDQLQNGDQRFPLGRYLVNRLAAKLGVTEKEFKTRLVCLQEQYLKHMSKGGFYYDNILEEFEGKRTQLENRHKIFNRKRSL